MEGRYITTYKKASHWPSCRTISSSLEKNFKGYSSWTQDEDSEVPYIKKLAITDHRWLSQKNLAFMKTVKNAQVDFYVFGDFTLKLNSFREHIEMLKHLELSVIVASEAQKKLVASIFPEVASLLKVEPYPVSNQFVFTSEGRATWREKLKLKDDEKLYGYAGRISPQKGILELLQTFIKHDSYLNGKLILAGPMDNHPFWQYSDDVNPQFITSFKKLIVLADQKIIWIPGIPSEQMPAFYSALDLFISPSTFHDEDFGLTVSEARSIGVKCAITSWGGYHRFKDDPNVCFMNLIEGMTGYHVNVESMKEALLNFRSSENIKSRESLSDLERNQIIMNEKFLNSDGKFNSDLYRKIYSSYL